MTQSSEVSGALTHPEHTKPSVADQLAEALRGMLYLKEGGDMQQEIGIYKQSKQALAAYEEFIKQSQTDHEILVNTILATQPDAEAINEDAILRIIDDWLMNSQPVADRKIVVGCNFDDLARRIVEALEQYREKK